MKSGAMKSDVKTGTLYKKAGYFKDRPTAKVSWSKTWNKHFFILDKKTMRLQYWAAEEESVYQAEGRITKEPHGDIRVTDIRVTATEPEQSMLGTKYPIKISGDTDVDSKALFLAATSRQIRDSWIEALQEGEQARMSRQQRAKLSRDIVRDEKNPRFSSEENQRLIMLENEMKIKKYQEKINVMRMQNQEIQEKVPELHKTDDRNKRRQSDAKEEERVGRPELWMEIQQAGTPSPATLPSNRNGNGLKEAPPVTDFKRHDIRMLGAAEEEEGIDEHISILFDLMGSGKLADCFTVTGRKNSDARRTSAMETSNSASNITAKVRTGADAARALPAKRL